MNLLPVATSIRSTPLAFGLSFAIAPLKGLKSLTIVWSIRMFRSARNRMRFLPLARHDDSAPGWVKTVPPIIGERRCLLLCAKMGSSYGLYIRFNFTPR